ncbi:MAG: hypothetical protein ACREAA_03020 [Candidatus Polarisedimenticolia bacterium]
MKEILPGVHHWVTKHPKIHIQVSSYHLEPERILIDPLIPPEGLDWFTHGVRHILLTNRHHYRHSAEFERRFGCTVWCSEHGLHEFTSGQRVKPFRNGDLLPGGIEAVEIGALCPDEMALLIPMGHGMAALADGAVRDDDGPLGFVPDEFMGDDPEEVKKGLRRAYSRLLKRPFDTLLLAHGDPVVGTGPAALRALARG